VARFDVRPATAEDAARIAELYVTTRRVAYAPFHPAAVLAAMSIPEQTQLWHERVSGDASGMQTLIAVDGDSLAGFVHFGRPTGAAENDAEVEYLYVATEYQRLGLGAALLTRACETLQALGFGSTHLWVYAENLPARAFYERQGWAPDGGERESGSAPGSFVLRYWRRLS
jgi:ribosomal protein S18 acetylase RimI-like enzyme